MHLFKDESPYPVSYPVLQHVLISTRLSPAWNPDYWLTQPGDHRYRMALYPHQGDWRLRYHDGIAFNYPLVAFVAPESADLPGRPYSDCVVCGAGTREPYRHGDEEGRRHDGVVVRFYEAEGFECTPTSASCSPLRQAWRTNLIEDEEQPLTPSGDGSYTLSGEVLGNCDSQNGRLGA